MIKSCEQCDSLFEVHLHQIKRDRGHFCSRACADKARSNRLKGSGNPKWKGGKVIVVCEYCGIEFATRRYKLKAKQKHFCSRQCANLGMKNSAEKTCKYCGRIFEVEQGRKEERQFCSLKCFRTFQRKENHPSWKGKIKNYCEICGREILVFPSRLKDGKGRFCSHKCQYLWQEQLIGEKSLRWMGGISFEPYCSKFNKKLKEAIRDKYGRRCFLCNKTEEENKRKLCVHHVDYDKDQGCNGKRWLLVPLCQSCSGKVNYNRDYWESLIIAKMIDNISNQTILDMFLSPFFEREDAEAYVLSTLRRE